MAVTGLTMASKKAVEAFTLASITKGMSSNAWNWLAEQGKTIQLASNGVPTLNDYARTGVNRYGTPAEVDNNVQEITCTQDKGFSFTVDSMGKTERNGTIEAAAMLRKTIDEVVTPYIDKYSLEKLVTGAGTGSVVDATAAITKNNAYETFLNLNSMLHDQLVPLTNRVAWVSPTFYNLLKLDPSFVKASETSMKIAISGLMGELDGVAIVMAPTSYLPAKAAAVGTSGQDGYVPAHGETMCVIAHKDAWVQPMRLEEFKIHTNPQGVSGTLVEGRVVFDAFVLERLKGADVAKDGVVVLRNLYSA